jgi:AGZA family xanthine/uracil permease-like MFS transporter
MTFLDRYFEISARGSTLGQEIRGGLATFFTMAYIVVLNPLILGSGVDATGGKLPIEALAAGTALVAGVMTILMGVVARFPLALAAGLGVNALVAYEIAPEMTWADAMGLVVIKGVLSSRSSWRRSRIRRAGRSMCPRCLTRSSRRPICP